MKAKDLDAIDRLLLEASRVNLTGAQRGEVAALIPQITDWDRFAQRAITTHLAPLLFRTLSEWKGNGVPAETISTFQSCYNKVLVTNIRMYALFSEIVQAWNAAGIEVIPLKGMYLAEAVYGDIGLRHLSDMDLLVKEEDVERCVEVAQNSGWEVARFEHYSEEFALNFRSAHPVKFIKAGAAIELHIHVHSRGTSYHVAIDEYWEYSRRSVLDGCDIRAIHTIHLVQHLCIHLYKHLIAAEWKTSSFCDVREVLISGFTEQDWHVLQLSSLRFNVWDEVQTVLWLGWNYWVIDVPPHLLADFGDAKVQQANALFLPFFKLGHIDESTRLERSWDKVLERMGAMEGPVAKSRYLIGYLFPSDDYMKQRYGQTSVSSVRRIYHPALFMWKGIRALTAYMFR
ncbi:MAG: nucleotidyltransferase family protein [Flavobacteriales bacterium]|nr:nucleotidyltransferase family protein [Flavobacteriales bacterium]